MSLIFSQIPHGFAVVLRVLAAIYTSYYLLFYPQAKNLQAIQLLLGHTKLKSTTSCLGIEVDDALKMAEQIEV